MFCGRYGRLHREDAVSKWIGRAFNVGAEGSNTWMRSRQLINGPKAEIRRPRKLGGPTIVKIPEVCQITCNGGWMSRLETAVKPILLPMMFATTPTTLQESELATLATWLTMKAFVFDMDDGVPAILSEDLRLDFGDTQEPVPNSAMWIAAYEGTRIGQVYHGIIGHVPDENPASPVDALELVLVFGYVALKIVIPVDPEKGAIERVAPSTDLPALPVWPIAGPIEWPPAAILDDATLPSYFTMPSDWESIAVPPSLRGRKRFS
jgi:hypothetical protein